MENPNDTRTSNRTDRTDLTLLVWYLLPTVVTAPTLGLPSNALVIRLLLGKPGICSTSEVFTLNLAPMDFVFSLMVVTGYIRLLFKMNMESSNFLSWGMNQAGGPLFLCIMSLDSYMAVCKPLVFLKLKDPKLRLSVCLTTSVTTVGCCILMKLRAWVKWSVITALKSCVILAISTCSILILRSLHQAGPSKKEVHPVKRRAFKIVLTAFVLINVHYIPPVIEALVRDHGPEIFRPYSALTGVAIFILSMSCFIQPLSYLIRTKQLPRMGSLKLHQGANGGDC